MINQDRYGVPPDRYKVFWQSVVLVVAALALLVTGFGAGMATMWFVGPRLRRATADAGPSIADGEVRTPRGESISLLWEAWDILEGEYIDPEALVDDRMVRGATAGLVSSLGDPNTVFVEPVPASIMNEDLQGSFEGIGATVDMVEGKLLIVRPLPGSPALAVDLRAGDVILAVDDQSLEGKPIWEAISLIRGPRGTVVRLLVKREGTPDPFVVSVTRDKVELPIVEYRTLDEGIAYLRLTEFNAISRKRVREALKDLLRDEPVGLILDLRGNPGGLLQMSVDVASEFLAKGALVLTEKQRDAPVEEYRVKRVGVATDIPLVVLVNGSSASASEIVAGAIHYNGRGVLVGTQTLGKGSVQNTHTLEDGSGLRVTVARWYPPDGETLDGEGIMPDIEVPLTSEDVAAEKDPQLDRAVAFLLGEE